MMFFNKPPVYIQINFLSLYNNLTNISNIVKTRRKIQQNKNFQLKLRLNELVKVTKKHVKLKKYNL